MKEKRQRRTYETLANSQ